jgi:hypothetical protein
MSTVEFACIADFKGKRRRLIDACSFGVKAMTLTLTLILIEVIANLDTVDSTGVRAWTKS